MSHDYMSTGALIEEAKAAERDTLLRLREVAERTNTPLSTIRRWVYHDRVLPCERVGPTCRVRVRLSVVRQFFPALNSTE